MKREQSVIPSVPRRSRSRKDETPGARSSQRRWVPVAGVCAVAGLVLAALVLVPRGDTIDWFLQRMPLTVGASLATTALAAVTGILLAPIAARRGTSRERALRAVALGGYVVPALWVTLALVATIASTPGSTLPSRYMPIMESGPEWLASLALPLIALTAGLGAALARQLAQASGGLLDSDRVRTMLSRGLSNRYVFHRHVLPRVFPTAAAVLILHFLGLSLGLLIFDAIVTRDLPPTVAPAPGTAPWGSIARDTLQSSAENLVAGWAPIVLVLLTLASMAALGLAIRRRLRVVAPSGTFPSFPDATAEPADSDEPTPSIWYRSSALLDIRGLRIRSGAGPEAPEIVSGVSLTIARGEAVGLLGNDCSGAHEIALAMAGLLGPGQAISGGSILFDGIELVGMPERSLTRLRGTGVAYLPANPLASLDPAFTVAGHLRAPLRTTMGLSTDAANARSRELLRSVGFSDPGAVLALRPADLTPIMAERVLIAGTMSCNPHLLIAHEPAATLAPHDESLILMLLHRLQKERGLTIIVVTGSVRLLAETCRQVAVVQAGMIVEHASISDLFDAPQHPYTRELLAGDSTR
ncbi:ABC transporter permease subunit [Cryobacterium sp. MLB-32]|uniref:ABC transporter permease subunit n=1 Tax=Cryobacterium sp. MLB-32 TaxID=1529318 RepID=UPI00068A290F|nr:ABC transporter permease subunit [Cryobacterium sp. MLB-32]